MGYRIVNDSIDAWTLLAFGELSPSVAARLDTLKQRATHTQRDAETPWTYAGEPLRIEQAGMRRRGGKAWNWVLYNRFLRADLCDGAGDDIIAQMQQDPESMYIHGADAVLSMSHALLADLLGAAPRLEVSEVTLCGSLAGWACTPAEMQHFILRRHQQVPRLYGPIRSPGVPGAWQPLYTRAHERSVSGFIEHVFDWDAPGRCRIYNKKADIDKKIKARREYLYDHWRQRGWNGKEPVVRVELTYDRSCLAGMGLAEPDTLIAQLPTLWAYVTHDVLRHVEAIPGVPYDQLPISTPWRLLQAAFADQAVAQAT